MTMNGSVMLLWLSMDPELPGWGQAIIASTTREIEQSGRCMRSLSVMIINSSRSGYLKKCDIAFTVNSVSHKVRHWISMLDDQCRITIIYVKNQIRLSELYIINHLLRCYKCCISSINDKWVDKSLNRHTSLCRFSPNLIVLTHKWMKECDWSQLAPLTHFKAVLIWTQYYLFISW